MGSSPSPSDALELGRRLKLRRTALGLPLGVVAGRAGMASSQLSRLESGRVDPKLSTVQRVAHALDSELDLKDAAA